MNTIIKIALYSLKVLNIWFITIPGKFKIFATFSYSLLMYFIFGACDMSEIEKIYGDGSFLTMIAGIFFGIPILISFFAFLGQSIGGSVTDSIDNAIRNRDNMMSNSSPKEAYKIMKKTAHLDVIRNNPNFNNALVGFNASVAKDGPTKVYEDLMKK